MKITVAFLSFILAAITGHAQYYYKDILSTQKTMHQWQMYKANHVTGVNIVSYEADNQPTEGFECKQDVSKDFSTITTYTKTEISGESLLTSYYSPEGLLTKTVDTTEEYTSTTDYQYNADNRIVAITNTSVTPRMPASEETHEWFYNTAGQPEKMLRIRNQSDTTFISFTIDDKGNVTEEKSRRNGQAEPTTYYYYNNNHQLTDIVRYNMRAKRLLPDYMFEYNPQGQLASMVNVYEGSSQYQKWYYRYNDQGLKTTETCFTNHQQLQGKIEYNYQF